MNLEQSASREIGINEHTSNEEMFYSHPGGEDISALYTGAEGDEDASGNGKLGQNIEERWVPDDSNRLLEIYLRDMAQEPLFNPSQELRIAAKIDKCEKREREVRALVEELTRVIQKRKDKTGHRSAKIKKLIRRRHMLNSLADAYSLKARKAKSRFTKANLRLVMRMANRYKNRGLPLLDLIQEGNIGLMRAIDKFDYKRGYKFSTYAVWWIQQAMTRALMEKTEMLRIPTYLMEQSNKVRKIRSSLHWEKGVDPTPEEIAEAGGIPVTVVSKIIEAKRSVVELDLAPADGDVKPGMERFSRLEFISDNDSPGPDSFVVNKELSSRLSEALRALTPREEEVIKRRYEIGYKKQHTLDEIGKTFDLTRERVRQLEKEALEKLRKSGMRETLMTFLA